MDGKRFDAWTRRRFGLAAGSLVGTVIGLIEQPHEAAAAKKKKRCRAEQDTCNLSGKRRCCKGLACQEPLLGPGRRRCCRQGLAACTRNNQCCTGECIDNACACKPDDDACEDLDGNPVNGVCCSQNCAADGATFTCQPKPI